MTQTSGFDPASQVKTSFYCRMFDVANLVARLNGEDGPGGTPSHEALSVSPQRALDISLVAGQPPSLDRDHFSTPRLVAKSHKHDERRRPSSQRPQYPTLYRRLQRFKDQCQNQTVLVATDNSTVGAYINKQGGTHSVEMCALLWKIMTWCHHYRITLKARHIPGCLNVIADLLSRSNQVQSPEWSLHLQVFKQICHKWFTPHVDLFATRLNHKLPLYVSPVPDQNAWDIDALNINWSGLTVYAYPPMALLHRVIQKIRQCNCNSPRLARDALVLGPSAALNRDPTSATGVNNSSQTVLQLCVSQQSTTSQPPRLVSRSGQLQEQGFSVEVAERIAAPQRSSTKTIYKSKWALFEKWCIENLVDFSTPSVKKSQTFSCTCTKT